MRKADVSPEQWERRKEYMRRYKAEHRERFLKLQRESQRRMYADPERRAHYNSLQRSYRKREYKQRPLGARFTYAQVVALWNMQEGACAVCRRPFDEKSKGLKPHRDHCHQSGAPRGLLCLQCNQIEGILAKLNIAPLEFGQRLHAYLADPPASRLS